MLKQSIINIKIIFSLSIKYETGPRLVNQKAI